MSRFLIQKEQAGTSRRAFTLIEILIVVVLVAIIIAAAIPAISQYKAAQAQTAMMNDGSRIGAAVQAYFGETFTRSVTLQYDPVTGDIIAPAAFHMQDGNKISPGYIVPGNEFKITFDSAEAFTLKREDAGSFTFRDSGELTRSE